MKKILGDSYKNMCNLSIFYNPNMDVNLDFLLSFLGECLGLLLWRTAPEAVCRLGCNLTPRSEQAAVCGAADALTGLKIINFFHSNSHCILFLFLFFLSSPYFLSLNKKYFQDIRNETVSVRIITFLRGKSHFLLFSWS